MRPLRFRAGLLGPAEVGRIEGKTPDEREQQAARLVRATMPPTCRLRRRDLRRSHQPATHPAGYYVVPESFGGALEMTGAFRLSSPIGVSMPSTAGLASNAVSSARIAGPGHASGCRPSAGADYQGALTAFEAAAAARLGEKMDGARWSICSSATRNWRWQSRRPQPAIARVSWRGSTRRSCISTARAASATPMRGPMPARRRPTIWRRSVGRPKTAPYSVRERRSCIAANWPRRISPRAAGQRAAQRDRRAQPHVADRGADRIYTWIGGRRPPIPRWSC